MRRVVRLQRCTVLLSSFPALARCDFEASEGEIIFLSGPNGSGKSTLLRLCAGLLTPYEGSAMVFGIDLTVSRERVRPAVGYLSHATRLYDDLTVLENLRFIAGATRTPLTAFLSMAERLGLEAVTMSLTVDRLSAGQRKRASLVPVLGREVDLYLLDEPHSALDGVTKDSVDAILREHAEVGRTVIVASHEGYRSEGFSTIDVEMLGGRAFRQTGGMS